MITKYNNNGITWIDIESPTKDDEQKIIEEYGIDSPAAKEILVPTLKPRVDMYDNFIFLVLHFPAFKHSHKKSYIQEIDFIIGRNFIITARYDAIDALYNFSKKVETDSILNRGRLAEHAGFIFFAMLKEMYSSLLDEMSSIEDSLGEIEAEIFKGREKKMVFKLSEVNRLLLDFKKSIAMHKEVLLSLQSVGKDFFDGKFDYYLEAMIGEYHKVDSVLKSNLDFLSELRETNNTLLQTKQNEAIKTFTILAFITFPLTLAIEILNIEKKFQLFAVTRMNFWLFLAGVFIAILALIAYFKIKKWL